MTKIFGNRTNIRQENHQIASNSTYTQSVQTLHDCSYKNQGGNIDELTRSLLRNIELYKDITIGGAEVVLGGKHRKTTSIDIMEMIEDKTKEIAVEVNNYKRCCHPEREIPEISKEMLKGKSIIESIESTRKAIMTEEFKPIRRA